MVIFGHLVQSYNFFSLVVIVIFHSFSAVIQTLSHIFAKAYLTKLFRVINFFKHSPRFKLCI